MRVKAEFANKDERLWPGAFVTVRLAVQTLKGASVVPQAAIIQGPRGKIVYVVDSANKAIAEAGRDVTYPIGEDAVVTDLVPGEQVVVDDRQNCAGATVIRAAVGEGGAPGAGAAVHRLGGGGASRGAKRFGCRRSAAGDSRGGRPALGRGVIGAGPKGQCHESVSSSSAGRC